MDFGELPEEIKDMILGYIDPYIRMQLSWYNYNETMRLKKSVKIRMRKLARSKKIIRTKKLSDLELYYLSKYLMERKEYQKMRDMALLDKNYYGFLYSNRSLNNVMNANLGVFKEDRYRMVCNAIEDISGKKIVHGWYFVYFGHVLPGVPDGMDLSEYNRRVLSSSITGLDYMAYFWMGIPLMIVSFSSAPLSRMHSTQILMFDPINDTAEMYSLKLNSSEYNRLCKRVEYPLPQFMRIIIMSIPGATRLYKIRSREHYYHIIKNSYEAFFQPSGTIAKILLSLVPL